MRKKMLLKVQDIEKYLLPVGTTQVYVRSYGDPLLPALVLTHGYLQTSRCWRSLIEGLSHSHQVIVWDLPGHGFSGPERGRVSATLLAESLHAIVTHHHLQERGFALASWSLGGMVTREYFLRYGTTGVTHLILIAALTTLSSHQDLWDKHVSGHDDVRMIANLASTHMSLEERDRGLRTFVDKLFYRPQVASEYYETLGSTALSLMRQRETPLDLTSFTETGAVSLMKHLSMPVLVLYGNDDALVPPAFLKAQLESLPSTVLLRAYAGCGHSPHLEMSRYVLSEMRAFLEGPGMLRRSSISASLL